LPGLLGAGCWREWYIAIAVVLACPKSNPHSAVDAQHLGVWRAVVINRYGCRRQDAGKCPFLQHEMKGGVALSAKSVLVLKTLQERQRVSPVRRPIP
jgi:hypothetical protein